MAVASASDGTLAADVACVALPNDETLVIQRTARPESPEDTLLRQNSWCAATRRELGLPPLLGQESRSSAMAAQEARIARRVKRHIVSVGGGSLKKEECVT